jgi:WD40 repeat protein
VSPWEERIAELAGEQPSLVGLAEAVSLAVRVDPPLLRKARLACVPEADAGTEADLWRSLLVKTRGPDGFVFLPEAAEVLRSRLARDSARLAWCRELTQELHKHLPPAVQLEEEIAWLSVIPGPEAASRIEELLRSALAAMVMDERRGLASWTARAFPSLPSSVRASTTALMLHAGAQLRLGRSAESLRNERETPEWASWIAPADLPRVPVAVRLFPDRVELDARSPDGGARLDLPATDPLLVDLSWDGGGVQVTFRKGEVQRVGVPAQEVRLRTLLGEVYYLRQAGTAPRGLRDWIIDFSEERERHRPFFGREREIEQISSLPSGLILVEGEVGSGKTAFLAHLIDRLTVDGIEPPHHFFRRGWPRWEDAKAAERSLIAQIVRRFPSLEAAAAHQSLPEVLEIVGQRKLLNSGARLFLILDAIDEIAPGSKERSPLLDILPESLPSHVIVLASARQGLDPKLPEPVLRGWLKAEDDSLQLFWRRHLVGDYLDPIKASEQNFGIAQVLRAWMDSRGPQTSELSRMQKWAGTLTEVWNSLQQEMGSEEAEFVFGVLAAARGPLPEWMLTQKLRRPIEERHTNFMIRVVQEGEVAFALREEVFRRFLLSNLDMKALHLALANLCLLIVQRNTVAPAPSAARAYGVRNAFFHLFAAEDYQQAREILTNVDYLKVRCEIGSVESVLADFSTLARKLADVDQTNLGVDFGPPGDLDPQRQINEIRSILQMDTQRVQQHPDDLASILYTGLRSRGWSPELIRKTLRISGNDPLLRLAEPFPLKDLVRAVPLRHQGSVTGCTFVGLPRGAQILSWSRDGTLRLWDQNQGNLRIFTGHTGEVTGCVVLDENRAVSSSRDCTLRIWNLQMEVLPRVLWGHEGEVLGILALDARRAVSWSADRTVRIWDLEEGKEERVLSGHEGAVTACALDIDAGLLVSGSEDATVRVWDLSSGDLLREFRGHTAPIRCLAILRGNRIVSGSQDRSLRVWSIEGDEAPQILEGHSEGVLGCAVSPEGNLLASFSQDGALLLWSLVPLWGEFEWGRPLDGGSPVRPWATFLGHQGAVLGCAFFSEGDRLVSCSADRTVRIWAVSTREPLTVLQGHEGPVRAVALDVRRTRSQGVMTAQIVSASDDRTLRVWNAQEYRAEAFLDGDDDTLLCIPFQDRLRVATLSRMGDLRLHRTRDPQPTWIGSPSIPLTGAVLSPNDQRLSLWSKNLIAGQARVSVWDLAGREESLIFTDHEAPILTCAATPDDTLLTASLDGTLRRWDATTQALLVSLSASAPLCDVQVSWDGRVLAASWDGSLTLWDLETGQVLRLLRGHTDRVLACALSSSGRRAVSASADRTLRVWDLETGHTIRVLTSHTEEVTGCAFALHDKLILSCSMDGKVGIWDPDLGEPIALTEGHTDWVNAIAVDEELGIVYSCSEDRSVRAWDLATGDSRGVVYGVSPFRSLAVVEGGVYAGDEAGNLWKLEYEVQELAYEGDSTQGGEEPRRGIFLSYSREDIDMARRLRRDLRRVDIEVWMDESDLRGGVNIQGEIRRNIERSLLFVALISRSSLQSPFFRWEWEFAVEISTRLSPDKLFIFLILIGDVDLNELALPEDPKDIQILHISAKERVFDEALTTIRDLYWRAIQRPSA